MWIHLLAPGNTAMDVPFRALYSPGEMLQMSSSAMHDKRKKSSESTRPPSRECRQESGSVRVPFKHITNSEWVVPRLVQIARPRTLAVEPCIELAAASAGGQAATLRPLVRESTRLRPLPLGQQVPAGQAAALRPLVRGMLDQANIGPCLLPGGILGRITPGISLPPRGLPDRIFLT